MGKKFFHAIGIERLRLLSDGEGITTLVAGAGCPLRCRYCLNPQCFEPSTIERVYETEELIELLKADDLYFQATEGGVVFGGGEPLLQADLIHDFKKRCPGQWKIYLESSLAVPETELKKVIDDIDHFIIDVKDMNPAVYRRYTGKSIDALEKNLRLLAGKRLFDKTTLRIPLIPSYNTEEDRKRSIEKLQEAGFYDFDLFSYNTDIAEDKSKSFNILQKKERKVPN